MADSSESTAIPAAKPIFDFDIACPQCEYNLRGLTERLCPECGNTFDPHAVLLAHRDNQPPLPIGWVVRTMYLHPLTFWQMEKVQRSRGPSRLQIFFALIYVPILVTMICSMLAMYLAWRSPSGGPLELGTGFLMTLASAFGPSIIVYVLCLLHAILCRLGLALSRQRDSVRAAKEIVGYGLIWFGPAMASLALAAPFAGSLLVAGSSLWAKATAVLALAAAATAGVAWFVTVYQGGRFASGGSAWVGLWCAITNPIWIITVLTVVMRLI